MCTLHQLLMNTLKMLSRRTRNEALYFALKPTATMMQAPRPTMETSTRAKDQEPWKTKPMKRKMRRMRPASWKLVGLARFRTRSEDQKLEARCPPVQCGVDLVRCARTMSGEGDAHYFRLSVSEREGSPAKSFLFFWSESERTMSRPPTTLRLRRKNERSKRRP